MNTPAMKALIILLTLILTPLTAPQAKAGDRALDELQAAYFFNFIKFTTWSPEVLGTGPLRIRIFRNSHIAGAIRHAPDQTIHGRSLDILDCRRPEDLLDGHAVFIPAHEAAAIPPEIWQALPPWTLVVSDWDNILESRGTIRLLTIGGKLRFAIDTRHSQGLSVSSKLLRLASEVRR